MIFAVHDKAIVKYSLVRISIKCGMKSGDGVSVSISKCTLLSCEGSVWLTGQQENIIVGWGCHWLGRSL